MSEYYDRAMAWEAVVAAIIETDRDAFKGDGRGVDKAVAWIRSRSPAPQDGNGGLSAPAGTLDGGDLDQFRAEGAMAAEGSEQ